MVAHAQTLTVTSPNGGETFTRNKRHAVTWDSSPDITSVSIGYKPYTGGELVWIARNMPNTGQFDWDIRTTDLRTQYIVRVFGTGQGVTVSDDSDSYFTLSTSISSVEPKLTSPVDGVTVNPGDALPLRWSVGEGTMGIWRVSLEPVDGGDEIILYGGATPNSQARLFGGLWTFFTTDPFQSFLVPGVYDLKIWATENGTIDYGVTDKKRITFTGGDSETTPSSSEPEKNQENDNVLMPEIVLDPAPVVVKKFERTLRIGSSGDDVKRLQEALSGDGDVYPEKITSGYYGDLTVKAVQRFQCKYSVVCGGSQDTTGYGRVGPQTRIKLNEIYGGVTPVTQGSGSSGLSLGQIDSIINLLRAFGASQETIDNVRSVF